MRDARIANKRTTMPGIIDCGVCLFFSHVDNSKTHFMRDQPITSPFPPLPSHFPTSALGKEHASSKRLAKRTLVKATTRPIHPSLASQHDVGNRLRASYAVPASAPQSPQLPITCLTCMPLLNHYHLIVNNANKNSAVTLRATFRRDTPW